MFPDMILVSQRFQKLEVEDKLLQQQIVFQRVS